MASAYSIHINMFNFSSCQSLYNPANTFSFCLSVKPQERAINVRKKIKCFLLRTTETEQANCGTEMYTHKLQEHQQCEFVIKCSVQEADDSTELG